MSWCGILGHDEIANQFRRRIGRRRLAHTYLFVGPSGIGKSAFARKLAESLLCERHDPQLLDPCEVCPGCQMVRSGDHPDLHEIFRPAGKSTLAVEQFIGRRERRMREGLIYELGLKPLRGTRKIAIIHDADFFNQECANCLLKTLEEPPAGSMLILIGTHTRRQYPTVLSRAQIVPFSPLSVEHVEELLPRALDEKWKEVHEGEQVPPRSTDLRELALASGGSLDLAVELADPENWEFRNGLLKQLASLDPAANGFAATLVKQAGSGSKLDGAAKRSRLIGIADWSIQFYRAWMRKEAGFEYDQALGSAVEEAEQELQAAVGDRFSILLRNQIAAECLDRTAEAQAHVKRNAHFDHVVPTWLRDLGRIARGESRVVAEVGH